MRLRRVEIEECRGIRNLELEPQDGNLVVWGYNGTGKSAIVDAIEFLLTGDIQRLHGEGTQGITLRSHGPHVDADPRDAKVEATVGLPVGDTATLTRTMEDPDDLIVTGDGEENVGEQVQAAADRHFLLTRKDILAFIQATDSDRADQMKTLLDLDDIEEIRTTLNSARGTAQQASENATGSVQTKRRRVAQVLGIEVFDEGTALERVNELRGELGANPLDGLEQDLILEGIEEPPQGDEGEAEPDPEEVIAKGAETLLAATEPIDSWGQDADELADQLDQLRDDPQLQKLADRMRLFEHGSKLVGEADECPLCGTEWEPEALADHVESCLEEAQEASQLLDEIESTATSLRGPATEALAAIEEFEDATAEHDPDVDLEAVKENLNQTIQFLQDPATSHEEYAGDVRDLPEELAIEHRRDDLQALVPEEDEEPEDEDEGPSALDRWKTLHTTEDRVEDLRDAEREERKKTKIEERASELYQAFIGARDEELEDLYEDISARFSKLYEEIHSPDEGDFDAVLDQAEAGVEMEVPFYGRGPYPPNALHSEGHQDSMGLCLFFALREHLPGENIPLVLLDDVVMSIDSGHRREVARLLREEFDDLQLLITTHDKNWARQLRTEGVVNESGRLDIYNWDVETGPKVNTVGDFLEKVREDLQKDVNTAAARLRRGAEAYFADACHNLQAEVVYDRNRRWTVGDFLPAAVSQMRDLIAAGKRWANQTGNDAAMEDLQDLDTKRGEAKNTLDIEQWAINRAVHFSRWEDLSPNDFRVVVDAVEQLFEVFSCQECDSQLQVVEKDNEPAGVACANNCTTWWLQEE